MAVVLELWEAQRFIGLYCLATADIKDEAFTRPNVVGAQYENIEIVFSDHDGT